MKPDVKKIIADIKATKGNRKFCNGLAGTLQDDNYASSICKYVKTVTPERIDLLIEYAEKLEAEVTDMAVQLANAESKCRELAEENAGLNVFIEEECFVYSSDTPEPIDANDCKPETPSTDAFLAEVRAQVAEEALKIMGNFTSDECGDSVYIAMKEFAAQLRKGVQS
ncbi:hypothetical protein [Citrobacter freundii]|uniref:hypothetical protein n=1 Tax=Citrobacter freundii TaxID=546 RepID=UPI002433E27A|nr:hypothetical protein [Citrobacter freundii]WFV10607.1 hypothetical protein NFJ20_10475 [Citrobacter freundii]